jgi:hypothetical protein
MSYIRPVSCAFFFLFSLGTLYDLYSTDYFWDTSSHPGIQAGNGFWSTTSASWSTDGRNLTSWPGSYGNSATFSGGDSIYTISVLGTQRVDSISFLSGLFTVESGKLTTSGKILLYADESISGIISSSITAPQGLSKTGDGTIILFR